MAKIVKWFGIILVVYVSSYLVFRQTHIEIWEKDKAAYVIFPTDASVLYYLWRPLTYADAAATGMKFHVGAHR